MASGFFRSKYFLLSAALAAAIVAGAAGAYQLGTSTLGGAWHDGCDAPALQGATTSAVPEETVERDGERRVVVYRLPLDRLSAGLADACSPFGDIDFVAAAGDEVEVRFTITGRTVAVQETLVLAEFRDDGGRLAVGAWIARVGEARMPYGSDGAGVRIQIALPDAGGWELRARTSAGDLRASDVMAASLDLESSFGDVVVEGVHLGGDTRLHSSAGDIILTLASVQSGAIDAESKFGDVELSLPERADVGYDVMAETSFGDVTIRIGPTEAYDSDSGRGAGERESARTTGFAEKPTQVRVVASSNAGDVRVTTRSTT